MFNLIAVAAATMVQTPPVSPPPVSSAQAAFNAATKAWEDGRCAEAVPAFDALAQSAAAKRNPTLAAAITVRRGTCLVKLGRLDEGEVAIRAGVDTLATGETFADEAREAYYQLAQLAMLRLDYDAGIVATKRALALAKGPDRIRPLLLLGALTRFDGDGVATRSTAEALQLTEATPGVAKPTIGAAQIAAARALMAESRIKEADALLRKALANNGGLTERTSLEDVATRYDLAQVALIQKHLDDARLYLAYTGAGRQTGAAFSRPDAMELPQCGDAPGMTPDSYAVVELSLADDGTVNRAEPVYAQGGRDAALAYARAVRNWTWSPETAKAIPAFYRRLARVELRCTRTAKGVDLDLPLVAATNAWLEEHGVPPPAEGAREADLIATWRAASGGSDAAALDANLRLARSPLALVTERAAAARRAAALATTLGAAQAVRTEAAMLTVDIQSDDNTAGSWRRDLARQEAGLRALLVQPAVVADPVSAATVRLRIVDLHRYDRKTMPADTPQLIAAVADARDLPDRHPLRIHALLAQANEAAAKGDLAAAATAFARTGLSEQQCALIGPTPTVASSGASSSLYPSELIRMGFEGWTKIEYDIATDGRTAAPRTLVAYPPFLFGDPAKAMIARTRYVRSYRPETSVACAANQQAFRFLLPK